MTGYFVMVMNHAGREYVPHPGVHVQQDRAAMKRPTVVMIYA
jgi:hypothetical protein